jgi:hypothetical protein
MVNYRLLASQRHHTVYNTWIIIISSYLCYFLYLIIASYIGFSKTFATIGVLLSFPQFYLGIFLISSLTFLFDILTAAINHNFVDVPVNLIRRFANVIRF